MGWLDGRVLILCGAAFLAGAGVVWVAYARQTRRPRAAAWSGPTGMAPWAPGPRIEHTEDPVPVQPSPPALATDPALAVLGRDPGGLWRRPGGSAAAAAGALDLLGVAPVSPPSGSAGTPEDRRPEEDLAADGRTGRGSTDHRPAARVPAEDRSTEKPGSAEEDPAERDTAEDSAPGNSAPDDSAPGDVPVVEAPRPGRVASAGDIPAQARRAGVAVQIPAQAGPRDDACRPDG